MNMCQPPAAFLGEPPAGCPGLYVDVTGYISYIYARMYKRQRLNMGGAGYCPPMLL
jgi:hypothetical protein